jgi:N6-L-threonylcarbamoyladenine synthase
MKEDFLCLGIETSCDETSVAVVKNGVDVLSCVVVSQAELHRVYGGIVPEIASRAHIETILPVFEQCLQKAKININEIDAVAVTSSPGLIGALLIGVSFAKTLAYILNKPLIGVDHIHAHIYAGKLAFPEFEFPCVSLVVSGGHTCLYRSISEVEHLLLGATLDDAAGEAFDKVAKILGLGFPGGPAIQKIADGHDPKKVRFKRPTLGKHSLDFSFSGLKTAVLYKVKGQNAKQERKLTRKETAEIAAGFQEAVCDVLVKKGVMACERLGISKIVVGGGVACNKRLREKFYTAGNKKGIKVFFPPPLYCLDNAAMVAGLAFHLYKKGLISDLHLDAVATRRR